MIQWVFSAFFILGICEASGSFPVAVLALALYGILAFCFAERFVEKK